MISTHSRMKKYCKTYWEIENYNEAVNDQVNRWDLHHKDEIDLKMTRKELIANGLYYDCKPERLIFLPHNEHIRLHTKENRKGKKLTEETKQKISDAHKGKHHTEDTKQKIRDAHKGKQTTEETKRKLSEVNKGKTSPRKGKKLTEETKQKMSKAHKGKHHTEETKQKIRNKHEIKICPLILWKLRIINRLSWQGIAKELNVSYAGARRKWVKLKRIENI